MGWIIDVDHDADKTAKAPSNANAVGMIGPRAYKGDGSELHNKFRMLTDDREVVYEGRSGDNSDFGPLDDFGQPNYGCTIIQYWQAGPGGGWKDL